MQSTLARHLSNDDQTFRVAALLPDRFSWLMGLYAENHQRLERLFAPSQLDVGEYVSCVRDGLDVQLSVQARHPYTLELGLSYRLLDRATGYPAPSAQLRSYLDAEVTEALHCEPGRALWQVLGPLAPTRSVLQHRLRMNTFLSRWLEYLAEQGHAARTLRHATAFVTA